MEREESRKDFVQEARQNERHVLVRTRFLAFRSVDDLHKYTHRFSGTEGDDG